jgi:hypothetical protein
MLANPASIVNDHSAEILGAVSKPKAAAPLVVRHDQAIVLSL